jgi:NDP-sugar pyrophosphorylase family protein
MAFKMHLVIPMSGQGVRYQQAGYREPKPLIPVNGVPMIERLLASCPERWPVHFILAENHRNTKLPGVLKKLRPTAKLIYIAPHKKGPSFALKSVVDRLPANEPVLVSYCDYGLVWDPAQFERFVRDSGCDACVVSYRGFHAHYLNPLTYAFSRMRNESVVEVREKGSFTDNREQEFASSGAYYFKSAALLKKSIRSQEKLGLSLNGEYYTSLTIEALLKSKPNADVRVFEIPGFFQWGTPADLQTFEYWERAYQSLNRSATGIGSVQQVLLPMAGLGSRFTALFKDPKPFITWNGEQMFAKALRSLPRADHTVIVTLDAVKDNVKLDALPPKTELVSLAKTPSGQALSVLEGVAKLDPKQEVLVSACDHAITLKPGLWEKFHRDPQCDAAIFTMKGYPGAARTPNSYSYVGVGSNKGAFALIDKISVKKPIMSNPLEDMVLVGTFWFRSGALLENEIQSLLKSGERVNGEYYLDSVFTGMIQRGLKVRNIPLEGYICWGDPSALAEALYWEEQFFCRRLDIRPRFPGVERHV